MFFPNCHCSWPRLPRPNRFGSSSPRKPPTPVPCPSDAPKLMFPVRRSSTRKTMCTSTPFSDGFTSGDGSGCWKKPRLETFWYERIRRSRLNRSPGSITIASRITRSWVTSLPTISILLIVAGERVAGHLEVHEAPVGVPARQLLAHVLLQLVLVVLALLEPPEALGPGGHLLHHGLVGVPAVALHVHQADGDPTALRHVVHDPDASLVLR